MKTGAGVGVRISVLQESDNWF